MKEIYFLVSLSLLNTMKQNENQNINSINYLSLFNHKTTDPQIIVQNL